MANQAAKNQGRARRRLGLSPLRPPLACARPTDAALPACAVTQSAFRTHRDITLQRSSESRQSESARPAPSPTSGASRRIWAAGSLGTGHLRPWPIGSDSAVGPCGERRAPAIGRRDMVETEQTAPFKSQRRRKASRRAGPSPPPGGTGRLRAVSRRCLRRSIASPKDIERRAGKLSPSAGLRGCTAAQSPKNLGSISDFLRVRPIPDGESARIRRREGHRPPLPPKHRHRRNPAGNLCGAVPGRARTAQFAPLRCASLCEILSGRFRTGCVRPLSARDPPPSAPDADWPGRLPVTRTAWGRPGFEYQAAAVPPPPPPPPPPLPPPLHRNSRAASRRHGVRSVRQLVVQ
jgi:hypothetical protein